MTGSECKFLKFLQGSDKRFVIPVYQRNYDWKMENCKRLYDDLVKIIRSGRKNHFFGSVVSVFNPDGHHEEYLIIDGQQRLTTVSLLLLAMYNLMENGVVEAENPNLKQKVYEEYLVDKWQPEETRIKLKPIKNDRTAFSKLFAEASEHIRESNLTVNYDYFHERIQKREITIDELYDAIFKLEIINIRLSGDDDPQMIFESLNSTGLDLSEGDKIRNFILMGLPVKEQETYYEKYWNRIEGNTRYEVSAFIRDYLSVKQQAIPKQTKVYTTFKDYVEQGALPAEELLSDMLAYSKRYHTLLCGGTDSRALNACIYRLNRLETTVTRPFFLEVLRLYDEKKLTLQQVTEIFGTAESYLFRRSMCDLPTNALNKIFLMLHREIVRYDGTEDAYVEKFKYALLAKKETTRFPRDAEFAEAFTTKPVYAMNGKNKIYILERLENFGTDEDKDVYHRCDSGDYSIEHIMPQHLTPAWQQELGENYQQIHEEWLHRIANLTLTAYNSKYSNCSFQDKKTMPNGFDESGIRLNTRIAKKDTWTLTELQERSQHLRERALAIWAAPVTDFAPARKQLDSFSLGDETDMTGRKIARFSFKNLEQPVTSWTDMHVKVCQILYSADKSIITRLAMSDEKNGLDSQFCTTPDFYYRREVGDGIYMWVNSNTQSKLNILAQLFKLYGEEPSDLVFYLRDENEEQEESGGRYERRVNYWTQALPVISGACPVFSSVGPTKSNTLAAGFGVAGFSICCVANADGARVELYLGKVKEENKKAFDTLLLRKTEIEQALGIPLTWDRGDDKKASKVYTELDDVSIENEVDWVQMARFHAEWARKFHQTLVPLVSASPAHA